VTFRILTIDGGGIRGIIPAIWLDQFEGELNEKGKSLRTCFDLICGTSTGSILAAAICSGISMSEIISLFEEKGPRIFQGGPKGISIFNSKRAKYNSYSLSKALSDKLENRQVHDAYPDICIPAYDIENRRSVLFRSYDRPTRDVALWQACLASSAAPTFFPPVDLKIGKARHIFVDGGVVANNPCAVAIAEAIGIRKLQSLTPDLDVSIISLGTGGSTRNLASRGKRPAGWFDWAPSILDVMFDGSSLISDHICKQILDDKNYVRMQFELIKDSGSDDLDNATTDNIECLKAAASNYMNHAGSKSFQQALNMMEKNWVKPESARPRIMPTPP
jgi:uncharacterized protein